MPRFAANLGYLYTDRPLLQRIDGAAASGFKAVELQFPYDVPAAEVKAALTRHQLKVLGVNSPPGEKGQFGTAALPGAEKAFDAHFAQALAYITAVGGTAIHCLAGHVDDRAAAERTYIANLRRAADLAAAQNITLLIEPINPRDRPGYFLNVVEHGADIIAAVGKANVRMQFDFYHVQIVSGDLVNRLEKHLGVVGHLQCAQVPVRNEPDIGEINYPYVFEAVDRLGYTGWIGCEYRPRARTEAGLGWGAAYGLKSAP